MSLGYSSGERPFMDKKAPTLDEWRKLYEAAIGIKELAPWQWMPETDIFGVQNPETGETGFVSVMGAVGEHYAVAVYLGAEGLYKFWDLQRAGPFAEPERMLEIPELQASFEDRRMLRDEDHRIIKDLGLKFRGQNAWPMFRSYRPGFFPWFLEADEVRFLAHALEQTLDVTARLKTDSSLLETPDEESCLVRVPHQNGDALVWEDQVIPVPPPGPVDITLVMDEEALEEAKQLPSSRYSVEMDLFLLPSPVKEKKDERPYFPYVLLTVHENGMVFGSELLPPVPSLESMWELVPLNAVQQLVRADMMPREIRVRSEILFQLLRPLAGDLSFKPKRSDYLPNLAPARESLIRYMKGR
jgi:hypothetical protein